MLGRCWVCPGKMPYYSYSFWLLSSLDPRWMSVPSPRISSFVSLVTNRVSSEEVCLPIFDVLNSLLNLATSCLDDENELPLKVITSFSASHFALPSIPLMVLHSLVTSVFCSKVSTKSPCLAFVCVDAVLDVIIQSWQFRWDLFYGSLLSCHHIQYLCWYRYFMEAVSSSRDVVGRCFE